VQSIEWDPGGQLRHQRRSSHRLSPLRKCGVANRHHRRRFRGKTDDVQFSSRVAMRGTLRACGCKGPKCHNLKNQGWPGWLWHSGQQSHDIPLELGQAGAETLPRCPETVPRQPLASNTPLFSITLAFLPHLDKLCSSGCTNLAFLANQMSNTVLIVPLCSYPYACIPPRPDLKLTWDQ
jgi:hypothetical protein